MPYPLGHGGCSYIRLNLYSSQTISRALVTMAIEKDYSRVYSNLDKPSFRSSHIDVHYVIIILAVGENQPTSQPDFKPQIGLNLGNFARFSTALKKTGVRLMFDREPNSHNLKQLRRLFAKLPIFAAASLIYDMQNAITEGRHADRPADRCM